jgi:hypothetical protein
MTTKNTPPNKTYTPQELKLLFEALSIQPSYLSKRYVLKHMLGWSDDDLRDNMNMMEEEASMKRIGQRGGY